MDRVEGIHFVVIAVGTDINTIELEGIASEPKQENLYTVSTIRDIPQLKEEIIGSVCDGKKSFA